MNALRNILFAKNRLFCGVIAVLIAVMMIFAQVGLCTCVDCLCPSNIAELFAFSREKPSSDATNSQTDCRCSTKTANCSKTSDSPNPKTTSKPCCDQNGQGCKCSEGAPTVAIQSHFHEIHHPEMVQQWLLPMTSDASDAIISGRHDILRFLKPPPVRLHLLLLVLLN